LSRLALGTVQFGLSYGIANKTGKVNAKESNRMIKLCRGNNIDMLDTAIAYGDSEKHLGELGLNNFKIVTKLPSVPSNCKDIKKWVENQLQDSLLRLGVSSVYGFLLHSSEQLLGRNGVILYNAIQSLKDSGKVEKIGVSIYSPNELDKFIPLYEFDLIQAPFNIVDRRLLNTGWLDRLKNNGIEIHARSVFLQGLLLIEHVDIPIKFSPWNDLWIKWQKWLTDYDISALEACLAYPMSFSQIDRVVIGADSARQLEQILNIAKTTSIVHFPEVSNNNETLINPSNWVNL
jgi:aryl-alcohol dehydrogenase-like predicted oxidoreductase